MLRRNFFILSFLIILGLVIPGKDLNALPQYRVTDYSGSQSGFPGGPFNIDPLPVGGSDIFPSFCIELSEFFNPGNTYFGSIEPWAIFGGVGAVGGKDPIDIRTSVLYGYSLDSKATLHPYQWTALQLAIWRIEQEINSSYAGSGYDFEAGSYNYDIVYWGGKSIVGWADYYFDKSDEWTASHGQALALNLWSRNYEPGEEYELRYKVQSQLVFVPEPSTLLLLGAGLVGLGLVCHRRPQRTKKRY